MDAVVAYVPFTDGDIRPVYEALDQRQYVICSMARKSSAWGSFRAMLLIRQS